MADPMAPIRDEVMGQPEAERLEYAMDLLAWYLDPIPEFYQGAGRLGLNLANADLRTLHALDRQRDRYVSLNALQSARCLDRPLDDWPTYDVVVSALGVIRRRLEKLGLPVKIIGWRGVGYCLEAPAAFRFEDGGRAWRAQQ